MKFIDTFEKHRQEPNKPLEVYTKELRLQLGEKLRQCKKIYLDTNYWLELRDVVLGRQKKKYFDKLLNLLQNGVKTGKLVCPISDENFYEILLQSDQSTLSVSASLIDELSNGAELLSLEERIKFEILYFIHSSTKGKNLVYHPDVFVWSKVALVNGTMNPASTPFSPADELVIQKAFFDQMWSQSLTNMINVMGMKSIMAMPKFKDISKELNKNKRKYAYENRSFKQLFLSEIAGVVDIFYSLFEEAFIYLFEKEKGYKPSSEEVVKAKSGKQIANLIYHAFKKNKLGDYLPSIIIGAGLHASVRQDIARNFSHNDMSDFRHAQAALPYFHYFFTEHNLRDLVSRKNIGFDNKYNCIVESDPKQVIDYTEEICS